MITGIIAEYNPFHRGHAHQIAAARAAGAGPIVAVMSGNFVQRGEPALFSKRRRAEAALLCGADLVLELPLPWALSTAQNFAEGGVGALMGLGCTEALSFGSESGEAGLLRRAAAAADSPLLKPLLDKYLAEGIPFAAAREKAAAAVFGPAVAAVFTRPNDTLAAEYLAAAGRAGAGWEILPVRRVGAAHDQAPPPAASPEALWENGGRFPHGRALEHPRWAADTGGPGCRLNGRAADADRLQSASGIRTLLLRGDTEQALACMPTAAACVFRQALAAEGMIRPRRLETALLCHMRRMGKEDFARLPDVSEGLENRLHAAARQAVSLEDFYRRAKTRRYPLARLRRLALAAFLGLDNRFFRQPLPYIRVLGFTPAGREVLARAKKTAGLPLILRARDVEKLDRRARDVFQSECRADDLFWLAADRPRPCGTDYTDPVVKIDLPSADPGCSKIILGAQESLVAAFSPRDDSGA